MKKTKLENQQQVWKGCKKTTGQTESMAHSENMVCRLSTHRKKPLQFLLKNEAEEWSIQYSTYRKKWLLDKTKTYYGRTDLRILWGEHNHTGTQPLQLFPEKKIILPENRKASTRRKANDWSGLPIWWRNIRLPIYSPKRLGHMGKQQTAGQIKGEWHSRRKEVVSAWPKLRKQTGYASLLCLPHFWISHNHIK